MLDSDTDVWGIDLGATNATMAVQQGATLTPVMNLNGDYFTSSAVFAQNVKGRLKIEVGKKAKLRIPEAPNDVALEFKARMGDRRWVHPFSAAPPASACALSAFVLRDLVASAATQESLPPQKVAVIGVPATFQDAGCNDTKKAARRAGFEYVETLEEPIAAAIAFAARQTSVSSNDAWLVYDLGGSTFAAALVRGDQGRFTIMDHASDDHLGGKQLDNAIVMNIVYPHLPASIQSEIVPWKSSYWWRLMLAAEEAKCQLSSGQDSVALVDTWLGDYPVYLSISHEDVNEQVARIFSRSLDVCRTLLKRNKLQPHNINQVLMIGRPSKSKYLRDMIEHGVSATSGRQAIQGLGIQIDCGIDPATAVCTGLALYGARCLTPKIKPAISAPNERHATPSILNTQFQSQACEEDASKAETASPVGADIRGAARNFMAKRSTLLVSVTLGIAATIYTVISFKGENIPAGDVDGGSNGTSSSISSADATEFQSSSFGRPAKNPTSIHSSAPKVSRERLYSFGFDGHFNNLKALLAAAHVRNSVDFDRIANWLRANRPAATEWQKDGTTESGEFAEQTTLAINTARRTNDIARLGGALQSTEHFLRSHFGHATMHANLATSQIALGQAKSALAPAFHAIVFDPDGADGYVALGAALARSGDADGATDAFCSILRKKRYSELITTKFAQIERGEEFDYPEVARAARETTLKCPKEKWGIDYPKN